MYDFLMLSQLRPEIVALLGSKATMDRWMVDPF
jgi:hypothetical protein